MSISNYLDKINQHYKSGHATEHTYRGDLAELITIIAPDVFVTNEPKRQSCGAPDYILTIKDIPIGFIEAKDIGDKDLEGDVKSGNKEQFDRYKASLNNLIFTDYINFHLYREGELITKIAIAETTHKGIEPLPEYFENFENLIKDFCVHVGQTIKSPAELAEMMAGKARLLSDIISKALSSDEINQEDSSLKDQMQAFKKFLIHDITPQGFADVYAQTIAYGMFAARLHDPTLDTFSRQEAAELIPKSNPFLRKLFGYIAGPEIDDRIKWVVENLSEIFLACNVEEILKNYGKSTKMEDPIIHFYETFLSEYDPETRRARGVWYTPKPIVNFIVRAVDDVLKTEFDLPQGLADSSKTIIKVNSQTSDKRSATGYKQMEREVHKVQILDPASGTGTFLTETIKHIYQTFHGQQGIWSSYAESSLLPRLNGFELLMASYAMAHIKLDLLLTDTGFKPTSNNRFKVYLTNSLEEYHPDTGTLFADWLSAEANEANHIKRDTPVMCIIGNPPYSGESANKGEWIMSLMDDYKKEPGGQEKLKERNSKWINDDYVKFLRYGQHFIAKNGSGVLAFINPHGFLDNPTFRGVRWNLLNTYDKIYTIDLHGNSKKKEISPDGSPDENVFDIQQGVSINILVKTGKKKANELGKVLHYDLYGKRDFKYDFLNNNSIQSINFSELPNIAPMYFMVPKDYEFKKTYDLGFSIKDLFETNGVGLTTAHDKFVIQESKIDLLERYKKFQSSPRDANFLHKEFKVRKKNGWDILQGYDNIKNETNLDKYIEPISYRPFDNRFIFYEDKLVWRTARKIMQHFINGDNLGLISARSNKSQTCDHFYISKNIMETKCGERTTQSAMFPLYLYSEDTIQKTTGISESRRPNLKAEIVNSIAKSLELTYTNEKETTPNTFGPIDILDYIYAVLYSPSYREKYKELLQADFPKVPYPKDNKTFWQLAKLGGEIRQIHLLESPSIEHYITQYPIDGDNVVRKPKYKDEKVFINNTQYFDNVPQIAWEFYIGGYQPAQKWLKDRKDRTLEFDDISHYQKIIVALSETDRLMKEIDTLEFQ
jgi:predicted helicase